MKQTIEDAVRNCTAMMAECERGLGHRVRARTYATERLPTPRSKPPLPDEDLAVRGDFDLLRNEKRFLWPAFGDFFSFSCLAAVLGTGAGLVLSTCGWDPAARGDDERAWALAP